MMVQLCLMLMLSLQGGPMRVPLPTSMKQTSDIVFTDEAIYALDIPTNTVFKLNYQGEKVKEITANPQQAQAPRKLIGIGLFEDKVYAHDFAYRAILIMDRDLNPVGQLTAPGLPLDALPTKDKLYLVSMDKSNNTLIQMYDHTGQHRGGFGKPLELTRTPFGVQRGLLTQLGDTIYFVHAYRARVDLFKPDGSLINSLTPPGHEGRQLVTDELINAKEWRKQIPAIVNRLYAAKNGDIYLGLKHLQLDREDLLHYSAQKNAWTETIGFGAFYMDQHDNLFKVETGAGGSLTLVQTALPADK